MKRYNIYYPEQDNQGSIQKRMTYKNHNLPNNLQFKVSRIQDENKKDIPASIDFKNSK
jgi:hypothetical protein